MTNSKQTNHLSWLERRAIVLITRRLKKTTPGASPETQVVIELDDLMPIRSIVNPSGPYSSTCGYCSPPGERTADRSSRHTASLSALRLSCGVYQKMIDRGWRRSGTFCYKPDMRTTCCPQYTIRLDTTEFKASRSQRKLVNRWNRFVLVGHASEYLNSDSDGNASKRKRTKDSSFSLCDSIHASEKGFIGETTTTLHAFETTIEPSSFTEEKYALFRKYQMNIHNDSSTPSGFERFLVESPLLEEPITYAPGAPSHLPRSYGSYHQLYRLDGKLVAVGVIDILPHCVSSVYFFYDDTWEEFSLGKLSALREISLVCEMRNASVPGMDFLYMGFYVHSCQKMRYKAQYSPSYLADPETYDWYPISHCLPLLDKYKYASFNRPNNSRSDPSYDGQEMTAISQPDLDEILMVSRVTERQILTQPITTSLYWDDKESRDSIMTYIDGMGLDTAKEIVIVL